jgi:hypothetical protein
MGGVILLGAAIALFVAWALIAIMTVWVILRIVMLLIRTLLVSSVAFVRWGSRRPRQRVVVLDR